MNFRHIWAITRKDLREASGNPSVWLPMLLVPFIFVVVIPAAVILATTFGGASTVASLTQDPDLQVFLNRLPAAMMQSMIGMNEIQRMFVIILGYMFAPMFLIIPLMFSTTVAAESFAGERERKTMEALLYSPATDTELFLGKMMAGLLPAILMSWLSFVAYTLILNGAAWQFFNRIWFPLPTWYPLIFWVAPALAVLGISITVLISSKQQTFMGAYQTSASTVVLVLGLVVGQATGVVYLSVGVGMIIGLVFFAIDAALLWFAIRIFNRRALLASAA
jgi:ABC-2 type transport system permease protein